MYVIPFLYRVSSMNDHVSIPQLCNAFQTLITKHNILRTALYLDTNGTLVQRCLDAQTTINDFKSYGFSVMNLHNDDRHINEIVKEILNQSDLFELPKGRVIRCHVLRRYHPDNDLSSRNENLLNTNDLILICIHHAVFDGASRTVFIRDLSLAYDNNCSLSMNDNTLQYIDYSVHEHVMDMTSSRQFWHLQLEGYNLEYPLMLPVDRQRLSSDRRSGVASVVQIDFNKDVATSFLKYASSHHVTPFQLGLATFYAFLLKLTHGETNLCISSINANRYRSELQNIIGMFVSTLPYRIQLDPHWSFDEVVKHVQEKCLSILQHSHYPLQNILADSRLNQSNVSFLETMFDFIAISENVNQLCLNGANLEQVSMDGSHEMSKFDFSMRYIYNPTSLDNQLSFLFVCSHDLFEQATVEKLAQRFQYLFEQLFQTNSSTTLMDESCISINKLSLILPEEAQEMQSAIFRRLENIVNEGM
jgi:NRPS condensation-like uncharacterized protein